MSNTATIPNRNARRLQTLTAAACLVSALGATPVFAAECTPSVPTPTNLAQLRIDLLPQMYYSTSIHRQ